MLQILCFIYHDDIELLVISSIDAKKSYSKIKYEIFVYVVVNIKLIASPSHRGYDNA
jgi:hypothetical protein